LRKSLARNHRTTESAQGRTFPTHFTGFRVYQALGAGVIFHVLGTFMNHRALVPSLLLILLVPFLPARQAPDSTDSRLATILHLPVLTSHDWQVLFSEADSGNAEAQYWLGRIYDAGRLLPKDAEKSVHWYKESAVQGYAPAEYVVCMNRAHHDEIEIDRCMWRAAENGVSDVQFWFGVAFEQHLWFGVTDKQEALKWFKRAAEGGNPDAEVELGARYQDGDGVEQNYALAAEWYRKAAAHVPNLGGAGQGRNNLGNLYMEGLGVPKDYVQAYKWFSLAGVDQNIAWAAEKMTAPQILQAQQIADDWKKQHPDPAIY
jgi:tetratricopeptide (TPR) repeat protein